MALEIVSSVSVSSPIETERFVAKHSFVIVDSGNCYAVKLFVILFFSSKFVISIFSKILSSIRGVWLLYRCSLYMGFCGTFIFSTMNATFQSNMASLSFLRD